MRFTNRSPLWLMLSLVIFISGCATTSNNEMKVPSWVDIYDSNEEKPSDDDAAEKDGSPESSADASDRISAQDEAEEPKEEKTSSLFEFFTGRKDLSEPKKPEPAEVPETDAAEIATSDSETEAEPEAQAEAEPQPASDVMAAESAPDQSVEAAEPTQVETPAPPKTPKPKALVAKNEKQALEASQASGDYNRALEAMKAGNLEDALLLFQEIAARYPSLSGPIVNQAIILRQQGKPEQAKALLQKAILNKTQNPYLMNEMGLVNRELGKFEAAKQAYLSAIRIEPNYDKAHYNLAVLADLYLHDPVLAFKEFEAYQALQAEPNKKVAGWLKEIKRRIK